MNTKQESVSVSLARQPIFDSSQRLWGYELVGVCSSGGFSSAYADTASMAVSLAASTYMGLQKALDRDHKIVVQFSEKNILEALPYALPPGKAAVKVSGTSQMESSLRESLTQLKADGYMLVVEADDTDVDMSLLDMADYVFLSVKEMNRNDLNLFRQKMEPYPCRPIAGAVQDQSVFKVCRDAGFDLFQGAFFKQPEEISVKKLPASAASRFQLFKIIEQEDPDFAELAEVISADVSISFRLLAYINSAAFGFRQKIRSIREAINMLGWQKMKNWLRVVVLSDVSQNKNATELVLLSAQRGKFLEQVVLDHDYWGFNPDSLFLLGMFSLLDAMLNRNMEEIVTYLPLEEKLKASLCRDPNSEYLSFLRLSECFEEAKWDEAEAMIQKLGMDGAKVKAGFQLAVNWSGEMFSMTE